MRQINIHLIAGARPNFMKIAPVYHALKKTDWAKPAIVHTGQHYDVSMSDNFFRDLQLPHPDFSLDIGSGSHAEQTSKVLLGYESICLTHPPDLVIVVGDVNSSLGACLAAKKLNIRVAHLEAGLRSNDRSMPEEINRILIDSISDILWTPSIDGNENLEGEGNKGHLVCVGNIMIDSLETILAKVDKGHAKRLLGIETAYAVATLHRPSNVDEPEKLATIVDQLKLVSNDTLIIFPAHPRTLSRLKEFDLLVSLSKSPNIKVLSPLSYFDFISLVSQSSLVITDSGGIQEETSYLNIPCITVRPSTERPTTVTLGTNHLCEPTEIFATFKGLAPRSELNTTIPLWDGKTAGRIISDLESYFEISQST